MLTAFSVNMQILHRCSQRYVRYGFSVSDEDTTDHICVRAVNRRMSCLKTNATEGLRSRWSDEKTKINLDKLRFELDK